MNYIGSKHKLNNWIFDTISQQYCGDLSQAVFCDLFAGTGAVGRNFKNHVKQVLANDIEFYSFVLLQNYIGNSVPIEFEGLLAELERLEGIPGFIFENYSEGGKEDRLYFTKENGQKIDAVRSKIEEWKNCKTINSNLYYFLLATLLESADKIANTASVYGAYLKKIKISAAKKINLKPALFEYSDNTHMIYQEDANTLIQSIQGDILYLDPPYNARQYGANYHLLNSIAKYNIFVPKGKTGLPEYYRSNYCKKNEVAASFESLIKYADFKYIFFSYNNEGLMDEVTIENIMQKYGKYHLETKNYQRFKADKTESRNHKADYTTEFLHILEK